MRILDLACQVPWAITPDYLTTILTIAARENTTAMIESARAIREDRLERKALMFRDGRPLDGTRSVVMREGVAVLTIEGPIFRRADMFTEMSGATSLETLALDFNTALENPGVTAICLAISSPGGEVDGIEEFSSHILASRGTKPITAYVSDLGASAAYWIASAADDIVVAKTALVGSIGVVAAVRDPSKTTAKEIEFVSSQSPKKRADPTKEAGKQQIQTIVDDLATIFIDAVATHRGVTADTVLADFGQGGVFVGQQAVAAGLVDRVGTFEQTIADLQEQVRIARTPQLRRVASIEQEYFGMATLKEKFKAMFSAMDEIEDETQPDPAIGHPGGTQIQGSVTAQPIPPASDPQVEALRTELAKARAEGITTAAAAFADTVITAHKAYPYERAPLMEAYAQAAMDDATSPLATPRTALLQAAVDARPAHHLTEELIPAGQTVEVLGNLQVTEGANTPMTPERRASLLKLTPVGQAVANGHKN